MSLKKKSPPSPYAGKRVLVLGLGLHGGALGATRWFLQQGATVRVTDAKSTAELAPSIRRLRGRPVVYHLGGIRLSDVRWADVLYQNQAVPDAVPALVAARRQTIPIVNETTLFFQRCPAMIIGVTGTRGKSTTTALIRHLLIGHFPRVIQTGNIREQSMLDVLNRLRPTDVVVVELSSFQLDFLSKVRRSPHIAVMTNMSPDHLNRHGSMAAYVAAKQEIIRYQRTDDVAVLNADNPWTRQAGKKTRGQVIWFSVAGATGASVVLRRGWIVTEGHRLVPQSAIRLPGRHNGENILAAVAVARAIGVPVSQLRQRLGSFQPLAHRLELIRRWRQHDFINDTTATSPAGTLAALGVYPRGLYILGGTDKKLDFAELATTLTTRRVPLVFLPGTATDTLRRQLQARDYHARHHLAGSMAEAVQAAVRLARPGQPIILSPGAASFGLFVHEFDRGEQFKRAVNRL